MNRLLLAIVLLFVCAFGVYAEDERIWYDAKINGKPVRFALDTGASDSVTLFPRAAQRLGLKVIPSEHQTSPGKPALGTTELCDLDLGSTNLRTSLPVFQIPSHFHPSVDGIMGWSTLKDNIVLLDAVGLDILPAKVPESSSSWIKLPVQTNSGVMALEIPGVKGEEVTVLFDTGSAYGVKLNPQTWRQWKTAHTNQPITLIAYVSPSIGVVVKEEAWADKISLGSLVLTGVPVMEADAADVAVGSLSHTQYEATLGLAALKYLDIIIDGKDGNVYVRPKKTPPLPFEHNRLGAVFVPRDSQNDDLAAHVVDGSPAYEAGIRNGDVLLKIGKLNATKWRTNPKILPLSRFWNSPAGTKLELTLKRGDKVFTTTAVLRNILPPDAPKSSN